MTTHATQKIVVGTLLAGLLGFSSAGFAQAKAIDALGQDSDRADRDAVEHTDHSAANQLATALDEYNREATQGRVPETRIPANQAPQDVAEVTRELSARIDAHNNTANPSMDTHIPAGQASEPAAPVIRQLSADLDAHNRTGDLQTL